MINNIRSFASSTELHTWFSANHAIERELWVRIFKKNSGLQTATIDECVVTAIAWGWIDGLGRSFDKVSYLVRLTPRRPKSMWSKRNCAHAERLIATGHMQPSGLLQVEAARADGRWEQAYSGSSNMVIPDDFLRELKKNPAAKNRYEILDRRSLFMIYFGLQTAKRTETRIKRMQRFIDLLASGQRIA